jgi:hypothetical protein
MRYMMLVRSVALAGLPPSAFLEAMGKLSAEGRESGMLIAGGQLGGADASARVRLAAGKIGVSDGPFPEAKEVIGGYAILEYADKKAALEGSPGFSSCIASTGPAGKAKSKCAPSSTKTSAPAASKSSPRRTASQAVLRRCVAAILDLACASRATSAALRISAHGCPTLTNISGAVRSTPARVAASPEKCCDECPCPPALTQRILNQARTRTRTPRSTPSGALNRRA